MLATVFSAAVTGLEVHRVRVEVSIRRGTPMIQIVGLAASAVREGRERIRAAAAQLGIHVPGLRITVNLAPAALPKGGAALDLPITAGILAAAGEVAARRAARWAMVGELGLDGSLRPVRGVLPIALHAAEAGDVEGLLVPLSNLREARPAADLEVRGAASLGEVLEFLRGDRTLPAPGDLPPAAADARGEDGSGSGAGGPSATPSARGGELATVRGQLRAKRALEIAAAGGHNLLMSGPPGAGKTTLARCLPALLPPMTVDEAVEATAVHSVAGRLPPGSGLLPERPFRSPHHTVSEAGLVGGGGVPRPGEVSLAHRGVLFLDELPEFDRHVLEVLRQPLEEGVVHIVRARAAVTFPARFLLVAALNPCPCGYHGDGTERCTCEPYDIHRYLSRIGGPLLDRIDLHVDVPAVKWEALAGGGERNTSREVRRRVVRARARAAGRASDRAGRRASGLPDAPAACNAELPPEALERLCRPDREGRRLLRLAVDDLGLSVRGYHRALRVARTIADLAGEERVTGPHVAEALQYRGLDGRAPRSRPPATPSAADR